MRSSLYVVKKQRIVATSKFLPYLTLSSFQRQTPLFLLKPQCVLPGFERNTTGATGRLLSFHVILMSGNSVSVSEVHPHPAMMTGTLPTPLIMDAWTVPSPGNINSATINMPFKVFWCTHSHTSAGMYHLKIELLSQRVYAYTILLGRAQYLFMLK